MKLPKILVASALLAVLSVCPAPAALAAAPAEKKVLIVVSSLDKKAENLVGGYWLPELTHPVAVFDKAGVKYELASPVARRGEVWLLSGGPGESGASLYPMIRTYQRAFPGFDLVIPDHRGTGRSSRICPVQEAPDSADGTGLAGAEWGPYIGAMYANLPRTSAFSVTEAAQDLGLLMAHADKRATVLLYGVS